MRERFIVNASFAAVLAFVVPKPDAWAQGAPGTEAAQTAPVGSATVNRRDFAAVMRGSRIYRDYCAACHGTVGQGGIMQGTGVQAPALNGSAHTWHHPLADLLGTIRFGTVARGGSMPPWGEVLSDQDMLDVIAWFQSKWSSKTYAEWQKRDRSGVAH